MNLEELRAVIDDLDVVLVTLLAQRMKYVRMAAAEKGREKLPLVATGREKEVVRTWRREAATIGLERSVAEGVILTIIARALEVEKRIYERSRKSRRH